MSTLEMISAGALSVMGLILMILLAQYLRLRELWKMAIGCQKSVRWARIREMENRELRSALRAEREHIEQLRRKVMVLQELIPVEG